MAVFKLFKETALPQALEPNAIYLVAPSQNVEYVEIYVTNQSGTAARRTLNVEDVTDLIDAAIANALLENTGAEAPAVMHVVDTYAGIAALGLTTNAFVYVVDATGDTTVASGGASYVYNAATDQAIKVSEYESMDLVITWDKIQNRPNSTPSEIDTAVANSHTHTNSAVLDALDQDAQGNLTIDGVVVGNQLSSVSW